MNHDAVKRYYGETLRSSADLKTNACCDVSEAPPPRAARVLADLHPEVTARYYGCGFVAPSELAGARILDLGCGAGRDVYLLAALAGPEGAVVGVDMTDAQLDVARGALDWHMARFGHPRPTVSFAKGEIERLDALGLEPESFDVVVSNCVINLSIDKPAVFAGAHALLKPGGEMYFSDVYADRRIPDALRRDPVLYGECLSGALYGVDFLRIAREAGFADPRRVSTRPLVPTDPEIADTLGPIRFVSEVWRLFKAPGLEAAEEDYGQAARYLGGEDEVFILDERTRFSQGRWTPVSANSVAILEASRFAARFEFDAGDGVHRGAFAPACCAPAPATRP